MSRASVNATESAPRSSPFQRIGHADAALHALQRGVHGRDHLLGVGVGGDRAAGGQHLPGDPLADGGSRTPNHSSGQVEPGGGERPRRLRRVRCTPAYVPPTAAPASRASVSSTSWSSSDTLSACAARASARSRSAWVEPALLRGQPGEAEGGLVRRASRRSASRRASRRGGCGGATTATACTRPPTRAGRAARTGLQLRGELGAQLGDQPAVVEREGAAVVDHMGDRGRGSRPGVEHVHAVGPQREPGLRDQRRAQLVGRARGQRRLGETAERRVRAVRAS